MIKSLEAKEQELVSVRASLNVSGYYFFSLVTSEYKVHFWLKSAGRGWVTHNHVRHQSLELELEETRVRAQIVDALQATEVFYYHVYAYLWFQENIYRLQLTCLWWQSIDKFMYPPPPPWGFPSSFCVFFYSLLSTFISLIFSSST